MNRPRLSIIVPSYNETAKIKIDAIKAIDEYLKGQKYSYEVLIVDDESTNGTLELVEQEIKNHKGFKLLANKHGGKAITVMTGLLKSTGEIALFTDMDQATPIDQVEKLLKKFDEGYDVVIGSRTGRKGAPLMRKLAGFTFSLLRTLILGLPLKDTQCGFKAFSRKSVDQIFPTLITKWERMKAGGAAVNAGFDIETLFLAKKCGLKITEVDVDWHHVENIKQVQLVKDSIEAIKDMIRIRLNDIQGSYS
jgi:dolichyl-phosphate beta-glucosyltransferase